MGFFLKCFLLYCMIYGVFSYFVRRFYYFPGYNSEKYFVNGLISQPLERISMSSEKAKAVKDLIESDKVVIFSKTYCPYCKMAKEVFNGINKSFTAIELDNRDDGDEIQTILGQITGARTVPRVFVNGECLGGGTDVKALCEKGELQKYF